MAMSTCACVHPIYPMIADQTYVVGIFHFAIPVLIPFNYQGSHVHFLTLHIGFTVAFSAFLARSFLDLRGAPVPRAVGSPTRLPPVFLTALGTLSDPHSYWSLHGISTVLCVQSSYVYPDTHTPFHSAWHCVTTLHCTTLHYTSLSQFTPLATIRLVSLIRHH